MVNLKGVSKIAEDSKIAGGKEVGNGIILFLISQPLIAQ